MKHGNALQLETIKQIELETMVYFRSVCERYGLRYYIAYGTLLGAVRHKGFIPWDDDIDVLMPRADYERLRALSGEIRTDRYELLDYSHCPGYLMYFMKLTDRRTVIVPSRFNTGFRYGLNIDIFPLDYFDGESAEAVH